MQFLKTLAVTSALIGAFSGAALAADADYSKFIVRGRMLGVIPQEDGTTSIGGDVTLNNSYVPELDLTYFVTKNIGIEAIAGVTPHNAKAKGTALGDLDLGGVTLLPPTVTVQYHFNPEGVIRPYAGVGLNYTVFLQEKAGASISSIDYDNGFGYAFQAGMDYGIDEHWALNVDVKKLMLDTDVKVNGGAVTSAVDIDPWIVGVGVAYRF